MERHFSAGVATISAFMAANGSAAGRGWDETMRLEAYLFQDLALPAEPEPQIRLRTWGVAAWTPSCESVA
ncbi:MAG TPA: hypothetical protein VHB27_02275 [Rhodopila sp.]|uniref:hypothetical protein n=1 Tax=Rhodopila sp. TaxID=2480087 RepID=UPI002B76A35C|nr:hypothetical protein [Rhodopila sp.]HVY14026.1 hypothetical protein [Rhodopila sp.]